MKKVEKLCSDCGFTWSRDILLSEKDDPVREGVRESCPSCRGTNLILSPLRDTSDPNTGPSPHWDNPAWNFFKDLGSHL